jgi:predicted methyltransferase
MRTSTFVSALMTALAIATVIALGASVCAQPPEQMAPLPESKIPAAIKAAIAAPDRPAADRELDAGRRPEQMMAFFDVEPGMKVADLSAGGGYTTELLSRIVGPSGKVYSQNGDFPPKFKEIEAAWRERLKKPAMANVVAVSKPFDADNLSPVKPGSLDAVLINLNYHDLVWIGVDRDKLNAAVFRALKPGGVYGIVDHSAQAGSGVRDVNTLHRIDQDFLTREVEKAGFKLAASSSALRHPEDDRTWFVFAHRGATDRFMLKFVKPSIR